jgi:hypothetical protein
MSSVLLRASPDAAGLSTARALGLPLALLLLRLARR